MSAPLLRLTAACLIALLLACAPWSSARAQVCTPQSSTGLNFGSLVGTPTVQTDTSGSITVTCTGGTVGTTVRACSYIGNGNPVTNKQMTSGANTLNFNVYSNAPGGTLYTASCSYHLTKPLFLEMIERAAADSGRRLALREFIAQALDHPEVLTIPETGYIKGAILEAMD